MKLRYLDYAAATPVDQRVLRAMRPYFSKDFGNPGSLHRAGAEALKALDNARETLARVTGAEFRDVVFTASATEANNLALRGIVRGFRLQALGISKSSTKKKSLAPRIIVSAVEHDSVLETARDMERAGEIELVIIPVDAHGVVDLKKMEAALHERTVLVSVMYVNNEIGTVEPLAEIFNLIKRFREKRNSPYPLFHTDAAQAFLYYPCNGKELGADLMTLSSQKIYGPKGVGTLILGSRRQALGVSNTKNDFLEPNAYNLKPILTGGGQEFGLRAGTENVPAIVGFAAAAALAEKERARNVKHASRVRSLFIQELKRAVPGIETNAEGEAPHIANLAFPEGVSSEDLLVLFDREGIAASPGAACSARALALSHVLRAIKMPNKRITRSIRFSFGRGITEGDARTAARTIGKIARYVQSKKS